MTPMPMRVTRSATKRARSPSSPGQYDRPSVRLLATNVRGRPFPDPIALRQKRVASTHDASVPIAFPPFQTSPASHGLPSSPTSRPRNMPQDWVSQTQSMRLESPASEQSGFSTPMTEEGGDVRIDEVMTDEPMVRLSPLAILYLSNTNISSISAKRREHNVCITSTTIPILISLWTIIIIPPSTRGSIPLPKRYTPVPEPQPPTNTRNPDTSRDPVPRPDVHTAPARQPITLLDLFRTHLRLRGRFHVFPLLYLIPTRRL